MRYVALSFSSLTVALALVVGAPACADDASSSTPPSSASSSAEDASSSSESESDAAGSPENNPKTDGGKKTEDKTKVDGGELTLTVTGQLFASLAGTIGGTPSSGVRLLLADYTPVCSKDSKAGATQVEIDLMATMGIAAGTYAITQTDSTKRVSAKYGKLDAQCKSIQAEFRPAQSGSITVTSVSSTQIDGSYSLVFAGGAWITGTFSSAKCDPLTAPGTGACLP